MVVPTTTRHHLIWLIFVQKKNDFIHTYAKKNHITNVYNIYCYNKSLHNKENGTLNGRSYSRWPSAGFSLQHADAAFLCYAAPVHPPATETPRTKEISIISERYLPLWFSTSRPQFKQYFGKSLHRLDIVTLALHTILCTMLWNLCSAPNYLHNAMKFLHSFSTLSFLMFSDSVHFRPWRHHVSSYWQFHHTIKWIQSPLFLPSPK